VTCVRQRSFLFLKKTKDLQLKVQADPKDKSKQ